MPDAVQRIEFRSGTGTCVGDLYGSGGTGRRAAIVVAHGYTSVRQMSADIARRIAAAGYVVLTLDYRSFGESSGEIRGELFPMRQVEDVRSAITYLEGRSDVDPDRIGLWGTSFGGGIVLQAAAYDRRARAVVSQVPVVDGDRWNRALRGSVEYERLLGELEEDRRRRARGEPGRRIRAVGVQGCEELVGQPADREIDELMIEYGKLLPTWSPEITLESVAKIIEFSPISVVHRIAPRPLMMVTVSGYDIVHLATDIADAFARVRQPAEFRVYPTTQLALYSGEWLERALDEQCHFFDRHLGEEAGQAN